MEDIVQLVERQIVALDVVGSSPTILPFFLLKVAADAAKACCDGV